MKVLASTRIVALAFGAGFVALACRAHVGTRASADRDGDGVRDDVDLCPDSPEDRDGIEDWDGCPELGPSGELKWGLSRIDAGQPEPPPAVDSDGDGIPDLKDACPSEPEDFDNFEDQDGCPDPDNDRDGIPDAKDKCPNEPETYNGVADDDGCPDASRMHWGWRSEGRITGALIPFDDNSAAIRPSTAAILDSIVVYLHDYPEDKTEVTLEGDAEPHERNPRTLAVARAAAVRRYLIKHGVPSREIRPARHSNNPVHQMLGDEPDGAHDRRRVDVHLHLSGAH